MNLRLALLACACLAGGGCARLAQAMFAPQQVAAGTAGQVANGTGAAAGADSATQAANTTVNGIGQSVDRLLAGQPQNAGELERIKAEVMRRALAARGAAGSAQDDPIRRVPWHPRTPELWPPADRMELAQTDAERGTYVHFSPLPDGTPAAESPLRLDLSPVRLEPQPVPQLPAQLPR